MRFVFLALVAALLMSSPLAADAPTKSGPPTGKEAPAFQLPDLEGRLVDSQALRGQVVVLNFWAFWCDTWKEELPHLKEIVKLEKEQNFRLVCISVDGARLQEFMKLTKGQTPYPVLLDPGGNVSREYAIEHVPTVIIVDPQGVVRHVWSGYPGDAAVLREVRKAGSKKPQS